MGLLQKACQTYDTHAALAGVVQSGHVPLLPVSHIIQKAQIEVTLDRDGNFVRAAEIPEEDRRTIIPASEASAGRTSGIAAHPLCDQLEYLTPQNEKKHLDYCRQLTAWADSPYTHPKVDAVSRYIRSGTLLTDLARSGLVTLNADGSLAKGKTAGTDYPKCLVRWSVLDSQPCDPCWKDPNLFQAYTDWYASRQSGAPDFCMISGTTAVSTENHPKGITAAAYGAKLLSANDNSGFTYRGRFTDSRQAATVSYLASQKAHSALQWVTANQGVVVGDRTFICWNPKGKPVFQPLNPLLSGSSVLPTPTDYHNQLLKTISGFRDTLPRTEDVVIASFDAATTGRLSLTYYSELLASDFLDRVEHWYATCCWEHGPLGYRSPSLLRIAECAFGTQRGNLLELDSRIKREQVQRLLRCVTENTPIPYDIVRALCQRASTPLAYGDTPRKAVLSTACAVIRKYHNDQAGQEEWTMALDPHKKDRSYQYGRLLAVLEKVERDTYSKDETRDPNAIRMQAVFCDRPMYAARTIHERLEPYFARLTPGTRTFYRNLIGDILAELDELQDPIDRRLDDTYLMGYYLQRKELYTSKKNETEEL